MKSSLAQALFEHPSIEEYINTCVCFPRSCLCANECSTSTGERTTHTLKYVARAPFPPAIGTAEQMCTGPFSSSLTKSNSLGIGELELEQKQCLSFPFYSIRQQQKPAYIHDDDSFTNALDVSIKLGAASWHTN